jgi:O-succinylbenzoate synthase
MQLRFPFQTCFGTTRERRVTIVKVTDGEIAGFGEVTAAEGPAFSHETFETAWHILCDYAIPWTLGKTFEHAADLAGILRPIRGHNMAKAGLENALWDLEARAREVPLWKLLGGVRERIACGVSIGIQPSVGALLDKIGEASAAGYRRVKVKIKPGWDLDVIREVRASFPATPLMADANSAYTLEDTELFRQLDRFDLMMVEQPLHWEDIIDHAALQRRIRTPICLDESIHSADDARKAVGIGACRVVNVKVGRVGGHLAARAVHDVCRGLGVPVWCGGMLESGIGRAHNVALSTLQNFSIPGDVSASRRYWDEDIIDPEIEVSAEGEIDVPEEPGIGYRVREDLIDRLTVRERTFRR